MTPIATSSVATREHLPVILIRGFGGLGVEDEKRIAYQGFNDGTVYPHKRGENYIYEGMILRFLKSQWRFHDATNVVGYYSKPVTTKPVKIPAELESFPETFFSTDKVVIDPGMASHLMTTVDDVRRTIWVFRYYDLNDRQFEVYGKALARLIDFIRKLAAIKNHKDLKVNIIAHSMGGLIVREALQRTYPARDQKAEEYINKIVTLGTPHKGISFQVVKNWINIDAEEELERFSPAYQEDPRHQDSYPRLQEFFPLERLLTIVGTNYRTYGVAAASWANRLFSIGGEYGWTYNRSDGLVKQSYAQINGDDFDPTKYNWTQPVGRAPRTFVHKCHGGSDSLVTSREAFEIANRFFFGNVHARLYMDAAEIKRGMDWFGKSEFFFGVSIKPRGVDFDLFHQSAEAENSYGPFATLDLTDPNPAFGWAGPDRLIWEGWLNTISLLKETETRLENMVFRLDFYVGERDALGLGFSDNVVFRKQYYIQAHLNQNKPLLVLYADESFQDGKAGQTLTENANGWTFQIQGTGFVGTFRIVLEEVQ